MFYVRISLSPLISLYAYTIYQYWFVQEGGATIQITHLGEHILAYDDSVNHVSFPNFGPNSRQALYHKLTPAPPNRWES